MSRNKNPADICEISLQPKDELCLSAYVDGECGWIKRMFARRTLKSNFEARKFVDELERTSEHVQRFYGRELETQSQDVSLWPLISQRIAQEERLSLLRSIPVESVNPFTWATRLGWGGLGAVAASALFMVFLPIASVNKSPELASNSLQQSVVAEGSTNFPQLDSPITTSLVSNQVNSGNSVASGSSVVSDDYYRALQLAALQASRNSYNRDFVTSDLANNNSSKNDGSAWKFINQQPSFIESDQANGLSLQRERRVIAPQVFEVDWVRSKGRVRVLQDSSGKAAILWVNRPNNIYAASPVNPTSVRNSIPQVVRPVNPPVVEVVGK